MPVRYSVGDVVNSRFRVVQSLGVGGMGEVLLVKRATGRGRFALKYCIEDDAEALRRFSREVRAMKRVDHPNVIKVVEDALDHKPPYFVMPVAKGSIADELDELRRDEDAALSAFLQVCEGVEAIHAAVGPHRDLKPDNALRFADGRVVVSDFGLAKIDPRDTTVLTRTSVIMGTSGYMAPEQLRFGGTKDADVRVDVYALGAFLFQLTTGEPPPPTTMDGVPPTLAHIIKRAMAQLASDRFESVGELAAAIRGVQRLKQRGKDPLRVFSEARTKATEAYVSDEDWDADATRLMLLAVRGLLADPRELRKEFDKIPIGLLTSAAGRLPAALTDALDAYCIALDQIAHDLAFEYAETVADKVAFVMEKAQGASLKAVALRAALIAASDLDRGKAWATLESLLRRVKHTDTAVAVAAMLRTEATRFGRRVERFRGGDLHELLRDVVDELLALKPAPA